jgi:hypothetical protein
VCPYAASIMKVPPDLAGLALRRPGRCRAAHGAALNLVTFVIISPIALAVFQDANQPPETATHLVLGSVAVLFVLDWRSRRA